VSVVLDSWALIAMLRGEPAAPRVRAAIASQATIACSINVGEVLYRVVRDQGRRRGGELVEGIRTLVRVEDPDWPLVCDAAAIKARGGLSYADAFCVATARRHRAPVYTGDPEIIALDGDDLDVIDLRTAP
jgi:predicted nucleic acid-binding protein